MAKEIWVIITDDPPGIPDSVKWFDSHAEAERMFREFAAEEPSMKLTDEGDGRLFAIDEAEKIEMRLMKAIGGHHP